MRFSARNLYYLRISASTVLPLYLYLDEQHLDWMSERVLQHVLSDLRPLIPNKLIAEAEAHLGPGGPANAKKGTVDVHRGDTYQFGYFLRNTEPHAVVIKTRKFTARPKLPKSAQSAQGLPTAQKGPGKKRKVAAKPTVPRKRATARTKGKGKQKARDDSDGSAIETESEVDEDIHYGTADRSDNASYAPRRSTRSRRKVAAGGYREQDEDDDQDASNFSGVDRPSNAEVAQHEQDDDMQVDPTSTHTEPQVKIEATEATLGADASLNPVGTEPITIDDDPTAAPDIPDEPLDSFLTQDEEEDKPKPVMSLKYRGFTIHGRCLCVIVEPYPPLRQQRSLSLAPTGLVGPRAPSIAPPDFVPSGGAGQRARTPLFLPEPEWDRDRSATPAPVQPRVLPPVPLFDEDPAETYDDEADGGMLAFSQILQSVGNYTMGAVDDDDDLDGMVFLGDADEAREI